MNVTGKKYKAKDNSWSLNLTKPIIKDGRFYYENNPYLAGTSTDLPIGSVIVTEPFKINVEHPLPQNPFLEREFIIVKIDGTDEHAMVMYFKEGVEGYESEYIEFEEIKPKPST